MIGSCDYCGEYCAGLGVNSAESFEFNDWVPPSAIERHISLVARRLECAESDGDSFTVRHVGVPMHDRHGDPMDECPNCSDHTQMDTGDWDATIDHSQCPTCWSEIAGAYVIGRWRSEAQALRIEPGRSTAAVPTAVAHPSPDRRRAEAALRAYAGVDLPPVRWVPSPVEVVRALGDAIDAQGNRVLDGDSERAVPPWSIRVLDADLDEEDDDVVGFLDERSEWGTIIRCLASAIVEQRPDAVGPHATLVPWLLGDAGEFSAPSEPGLLRALVEELQATTGSAVILPSEIVVSERALRCLVDEAGRPHATEGPAIAYRDGFTVYAWHGVVVPEWLIRNPERLDVETIDAADNVEVRRVMVERFGAERLIREGGAELVHEDETGRLWRRTLPTIKGHGHGWGPRVIPDEPVTYVEVLNSTPEPDGSRRTYFLRVPPATRTAREAVAWTFELAGGDYHPAAES